MQKPVYLSIIPEETGKQIKRLMDKHGYSVKDIQQAMWFENPQSIYKWLSGKTLPSLENFLILSQLFEIDIESMLVIRTYEDA